jgi:hypothetical protein
MEILTNLLPSLIEEFRNAIMENIREQVKKYGISTQFDKEKKRILFSLNSVHKMSIFSNKYMSECDGLILETCSFRPLVVPMPTLQYVSGEFHRNFRKMLEQKEYNIKEAKDGTTINLYYWHETSDSENKENVVELWKVSTKHLIDASNKKSNKKTYRRMLTEILENFNINIENFYDSLNPTRCYTFGFKHPDIHQFFEGRGEPIYDIWFIQSVDLLRFQEIVAYNIRLVGEEKYDERQDCKDCISYESPHEKIIPQENIDCSNLETYFFKPIVENALSNFRSNDGAPKYGFLFRTKKEKVTYNANFKNVFLESDLLRIIRHLWYDKRLEIDSKENLYNKKKYIVLRAYLSRKCRNVFLELFPQYSGDFTYLDEITHRLANDILNYGDISISDAKSDENEDKKEEDTYNDMLRGLKARISHKINLRNKDVDFVKNFLISRSNLQYFYPLYEIYNP